MSRSKTALAIFLCLCVPFAAAFAQQASLISDEMIQTETVNYSKTAVVEAGVYERSYSASAAEYYPYTYALGVEVDNASFLNYHVARRQPVKAGDLLATFTLDIDEAAYTSTQLSLERAQKDYQTGIEKKTEEIAELLKEHSRITDPYERELMTLRIRRAQLAYEQYCYQQDCLIKQLQEQLTEMEEANSQNQLFAPFDGVIADLTYKRVGERVYANEVMVTMYREDGMLLRINNDNLYFRYGMPVTVSSGAKNDTDTYQGRVVAADNLLPDSRRLGYAFIELEPFEGGEKPRLTHLSAAGTSQHLADVMVIPRRAVFLENGKSYVECLVNGSLQKRFVNVGIMNTNDVWVLQGLAPGDTVVID